MEPTIEQTKEQTAVYPYTAESFTDGHEIAGTDEKGRQLRYVLLIDGRIAKIREGKGKDVERATMEAGGDSSKYFSSMMAGTTEIDGKAITMYELADLSMKDYMRLQVAFSDINF
jgi:hypothetical protein